MSVNGGHANNGEAADTLRKILLALDVVHNPHSTNSSRLEAQSFLEQVKDEAEAPLHGFELASDKSLSPVVRHYALSLLEHAIRYRWSTYSSEQARTLRNWVVELSRAVSKDDASYLRNKIATLWVEITNRSWGSEWMDMDFMLVQLWQVADSTAHKELVLLILETLSEAVFTRNDPVAASREGILNAACVEIFTPAAILIETFPNRQAGPDVRHDHQGWLSRLSEFLNYCISSGLEVYNENKTCIIKGFEVLQTLMVWTIPKAISFTNCVAVMTAGLASPSIEVQKAALDGLFFLYRRPGFSDEEFQDLVVPAFSLSFVELCKRLFNWSEVDPKDIDEDRYEFQQRLSEMLSSLGDYFGKKFKQIPETAAREEFIWALVSVVHSQSILVCMPALVTWDKLLDVQDFATSKLGYSLMANLLDVCCDRLIRYDQMDGEMAACLPTCSFLLADAETIPERHALVGNYRRYSGEIIERITLLNLVNAVSYVLGRAEEMFQQLYDDWPFSKENYVQNTWPALRVDASFSVIECALKAYAKWRRYHLQDRQQTIAEIDAKIETFFKKLLGVNLKDPLVRKRALALARYISLGVLDKNVDFMIQTVEHIMTTWPALEPEHPALNDAIKEYQHEGLSVLQRLACAMPDHLLRVYDEIEARINQMKSLAVLDEKRMLFFDGFLFTIIQRSSGGDTESKLQRLLPFIEPVKARWSQESIQGAFKSWPDFCEVLALDKAQVYLASRQAHMVQDWGSAELDAEGLALQVELEERLKQLPLRPVKEFLSFSEKQLDRTSAAFQVARRLWSLGFATLLQDVLKLLSFAHCAHNPNNWTLLPMELRSMVDRVMSDRFWQAGISEGSKDDFYARVMGKKNTLEGLGSSIRGTIRSVREMAYTIIYTMSRFDAQFFGWQQLSQSLSKALFADSFWLSTHQQSNLLNLVRYLVDECPVNYREPFLPQFLASCFQQMDAKINMEWQKMEESTSAAAGAEDDLKEEMKSESILRQVTHTAVVMVADFLDPTKPNPPGLFTDEDDILQYDREKGYPSLRNFCLTHREIVEPLLVFCTHVIRIKDTRCCGMILRLFFSLVPEFASPRAGSEAGPPRVNDAAIPPETASVIREYMSSDVLRACVNSFHEAHFVEVQKELASLIAAIVVHYTPDTPTPGNVLLGLPHVDGADLERLRKYMDKPAQHLKQQRAIVFEFLKNLKGVRVSELGKLNQSAGFGSTRHSKKCKRSRMAQAYMARNSAEPRTGGGTEAMRDTSDALEGLANLFE